MCCFFVFLIVVSFCLCLLGLQLGSEHILGRAVVQFAKQQKDVPQLSQPADFAVCPFVYLCGFVRVWLSVSRQAVSGLGIRCTVDTKSVIIGNRGWLNQNKVAVPPTVEV